MKRWFYYPSFLSKQGLLFEAKKAFLYPGSDYPCPIKAFVKVNLFKINCFTKNVRTGKKEDYGTTMKSWYLANHHMMDDSDYGGSIYYRSPATCWKMNKRMFRKINPIKEIKLKQLEMKLAA
jgi:hypothetical protein